MHWSVSKKLFRCIPQQSRRTYDNSLSICDHTTMGAKKIEIFGCQLSWSSRVRHPNSLHCLQVGTLGDSGIFYKERIAEVCTVLIVLHFTVKPNTETKWQYYYLHSLLQLHCNRLLRGTFVGQQNNTLHKFRTFQLTAIVAFYSIYRPSKK